MKSVGISDTGEYDNTGSPILISNYYEHLVLERIGRLLAGGPRADDADYIADVACVALNKLPPRYVRHIVDVSFYMSAEEQQQINAIIGTAVTRAMEFIDKRAGERPDGSAHKR